VELFINLSALFYLSILPSVLKKAYSHQICSGEDAMLEYGYEVVFACRNFVVITIISLPHGYLLPNNCIVILSPLLNFNAFFTLKLLAFKRHMWLFMAGVAI